MQPASSLIRLIDSLPDLVLEVSRDGLICAHAGGTALPQLKPHGDAAGKLIDSLWSPEAATALRQASRKALATRTSLDLRIAEQGRDYEMRVIAQGPERVLVVLRPERARNPADAEPSGGEFSRPHLDRRAFMQNFVAAVAHFSIAEKPAALAVVQLEGVNAIARAVDARISEEVVNAAILRLPAGRFSLGQINKSTLALLMETSDRSVIEACLAEVADSLRQAIAIGDAQFQLTPYAGVALLGQDATSAKDLLEHARIAALEARRAKSPVAHFFSDTLRLKSLARLDMSRELREAIETGGIGLRYVGRYDLAHGNLVAVLAYVRWTHPLRGEIAPREFLGLAESTGAAVDLSRAMLNAVEVQVATYGARMPPQVRFSFGPLRHHLLHEDFLRDIDAFLGRGGVAASRLEIRIAERTFIVAHPTLCQELKQRGIQLVVDEVARGMGSLDRLARAPLWGLQLDRQWVQNLRDDEVAVKVCRAGIGAACALGLVPSVSGVDSEEQRAALLRLGCPYGSGEVFGALSLGPSARCA